MYGEKTKNHGKWETHTVGQKIIARKTEKREKWERHTVGHGV